MLHHLQKLLLVHVSAHHADVVLFIPVLIFFVIPFVDHKVDIALFINDFLVVLSLIIIDHVLQFIVEILVFAYFGPFDEFLDILIFVFVQLIPEIRQAIFPIQSF